MDINLIDIFGHKKISGLDISHHAVSYSELSMDRKKNWRLIKVAREVIQPEHSHDDKAALIPALGRLRSSIGRDRIEVITNLNGTSVRNSLIQTPVLDYKKTYEWLDANNAVVYGYQGNWGTITDEELEEAFEEARRARSKAVVIRGLS